MSSEKLEKLIADITEFLKNAYTAAGEFAKVATHAYEYLSAVTATIPSDLRESADRSIGVTIDFLKSVRDAIDKRISELEEFREKLKAPAERVAEIKEKVKVE